MRRYRVEVAPQARRDLIEIRAWYRNRLGPRAAAKVQRTIADTLRALQTDPPLHEQRSDLPKGYFRAVAKRHLVIFRLDDEIVRVVRVVHGARDIMDLLTIDD